MTESLFRTEAIDAKYGHRYGNRVIAPTVRRSVATAFVVTVAVSVVLFLLFGSYTPRDSVRGFVTTDTAGVRLYAPGDATVETILVGDGDIVSRGQKLLILDTSRTARRDRETGQTIVIALHEELAAVERLAKADTDRFGVRRKQLQRQLADLTLSLPLVLRQLEAARDNRDLAFAESQRLSDSSVAQFVSASRRDAADAAVLEKKQTAMALQLQLNSVRAGIAQVELEIANNALEKDSRTADTTARIARLNGQIAEASSQHSQHIVASADGRVSGLIVRSGQVVSSREPLLGIVPVTANFVAQLLIPGKSIGFVSPGLPVNVRFDAFPYQTFGVRRGRITRISEMATLPGERRIPVATDGPYYIAHMNFVDDEPNPGRLILHEGMTVSADILRREKRLITWLLEPITKAALRSAR